MKKSILLLCFAVMLSATISGCAYYAKGPWKGRVLDADSKEPIEGAAVVIYWNESVYSIPESHTSFLYANETVTDGDGRFNIPSQSIPSKVTGGTINGPFWIIYKNKYDFYPYAHLEEDTDSPFNPNESVVLLNKMNTIDERKKMVRIVESYLMTIDYTEAPEADRMMQAEKNELNLSGY